MPTTMLLRSFTAGVLDHSNEQVTNSEGDGVDHLGIHGGTQDHERFRVQVYERGHKRLPTTDRADESLSN